MTSYEEMSAYVEDPDRHSVCAEMAKFLGAEKVRAKNKIAFASYESASQKAKDVKVENDQFPYICQFCQYWHLGGNKNVGTADRIFVIPAKKVYYFREEIKEDRPLHIEIQKLKMAQFEPLAVDEFRLEKLSKKNRLECLNAHRLNCFTIGPRFKAVAWALHIPAEDQPIILKTSRGFIFRSRAGEYWDKSIDL